MRNYHTIYITVEFLKHKHHGLIMIEGNDFSYASPSITDHILKTKT